MLKSLYSGISGLKVNQQKLDVIGNNIANVSTTSFKGSTVNFQNMLSQSVSEGQGASLNQGGVNASRIGLGVKIGSIAINQAQGSMTPTGTNTDLAIDGDGYFMVEKGVIINDPAVNPITIDVATHLNTPISDNKILYTRDGSFLRDNKGNLVNADGLRVLGYAVTDAAGAPSIVPDTTDTVDTTAKSACNYIDAKNTVTAIGENLLSLVIPDTVNGLDSAGAAKAFKVTKVNITSDGLIIATLENGAQSALGQIAMATFNNPNGLKDIGGNINEATSNSGNPVIISGIGADPANDNSKGYGDINSGFLEASNVDLAQQFTEMIVTTRAFEANGKTISNGDEILQTIIGLKR